MGRDISIAISAHDNYSEVLKKMQNANKTFGRSVDGLQEKLDALEKNKIELQIDYEKAKQALKEAKKGLDDTKESMDRLEKAQLNFDNVKQNFDAVNRVARQTQKEMDNAGTSISKLDNRMATMQSGNNLLSRIGQAGVLQFGGSLAADVFSNSMGAYFNSALPGDEATVANNILGTSLSSAASGAAIGTMIAPGIGTAIGGVLGGIGGAIAGWFNGETQVFENEDEAFKTFVQSQYEKVTQSASEELQGGIGVAGDREQKRIAFGTIFRDENEKEISMGMESRPDYVSFSDRFLNEIKDMADHTPYGLDQLTSLSKTLSIAYGSDTKKIKETMTILGDAGSALSMTESDMQMLATGLFRMKNEGKATKEVLDYFSDRGVKVYNYLAEAEGKSVKDVMKQLSSGKISGDNAIQVILDYLQNDYQGSMEIQANSFQGLTNTLQDAQTDIKNAMGEGYSEIRKGGLKEQIDWYGSDTGKELEEMNRGIGQWQAELDNRRDEIYRETMNQMLKSDDYKVAKETGDKSRMYILQAQAESEAYMKYTQDEGFKEQKDANLTLTRNLQQYIQQDDTFQLPGYEMGQQFSVGLKGTTQQIAYDFGFQLKKELFQMGLGTYSLGTLSTGVEIAQDRINLANSDEYSKYIPQSIKDSAQSALTNNTYTSRLSGYAFGLERVPYDNYLALLHEGERVLTAQEARQQNNTPVININLSGVTIREDADIQRIAKEFMREYNKARMAMP